MKHTDYLAWKARLTQLTEEQRGQVMTSLKVLGVKIKEEIQEQTQDDDWLTKGLFMALRKKLKCTQQDEWRIKRSQAFKEYRAIAPDLCRKLGTLIPKEGNSNAKASLAYLAGIALITWCVDSPVGKDWFKDGVTWKQRPVTGNRVFERAPQILQALDAQFPGYIQANLFGLVFAAINNKGSKNVKAVVHSKARKSVRHVKGR